MALHPGDLLPSFRAVGLTNPQFVFDTAAGRYLMLGIFSGADPESIRQGVAMAEQARPLFDDVHASLFVILPNADEWKSGREDAIPGLRWLFDDGPVRETLGVGTEPLWILCDPELRVLAVAGPDQSAALFAGIGTLPAPGLHAGMATASPAPVLIVPRIFEPDLCRILIDHYDATGGEPSGFMREVEGRTRLMTDPNHKRRSDVLLDDTGLIDVIRSRLSRRLVPQIQKAFQFSATRVERYLIACYDAETGGHFRPHRDNTTKGTAHRRFAVSINLNADFDGGDLRFPEYPAQYYRPPPGGAAVFSCSLLHEVSPVSRGRRFAFLPFLYDEKAAVIRDANRSFVDQAPSDQAPSPSP